MLMETAAARRQPNLFSGRNSQAQVSELRIQVVTAVSRSSDESSGRPEQAPVKWTGMLWKGGQAVPGSSDTGEELKLPKDRHFVRLQTRQVQHWKRTGTDVQTAPAQPGVLPGHPA